MSSARSSLSHRQDGPLTDETTTTPRPLALGEVLGDEKKAPPSRRNELEESNSTVRGKIRSGGQQEDHHLFFIFRTGAPPITRGPLGDPSARVFEVFLIANHTLELFLSQLG